MKYKEKAEERYNQALRKSINLSLSPSFYDAFELYSQLIKDINEVYLDCLEELKHAFDTPETLELKKILLEAYIRRDIFRPVYYKNKEDAEQRINDFLKIIEPRPGYSPKIEAYYQIKW